MARACRRWRVRLPGSVLLLALLAGCGGGEDEGEPLAAVPPPAEPALPADPAALARQAPASPEVLTYLPPTGRPAPVLDRYLGAAPEVVFDSVQEALRGGGLRITHLDERRGLITATYAGDGRSYLNCGAITAVPERGTPRMIEASTQAISFRPGPTAGGPVVERELILNARVVVRLRPDDGGTRLRSSVTYVVSKRVSAAGSLQVETVAFESGGRGRFAIGTVCQPNGALERLPLAVAGA